MITAVAPSASAAAMLALKWRNLRRECRNQADAANVLPRDLTAYMIGCLEDHSQTPVPDGNQ